MNLETLSIVNFKNYSQAELEFSSRINCFVGDNGTGKTNLLDAIHYLALCKSYFNSIDSHNIKHEEDFSVIQGGFSRKEKSESIYCGIQRNKRKVFKRNKKDYQRLSEHIGLIPLVMISPADNSLIMDGGEERRKFINNVISQYDREFLDNLIHYNRSLSQRNKLLKQMAENSSNDPDILSVYNDQMINYGEAIYKKRKTFIDELLPVFSRFYQYISAGNEKVELLYKSQLHDKNMKELLEESLYKDKFLQYSTAGIHRDDLEMLLNSYPLKKTGSQGQQKTFQVALKMAKFEFIRKASGITPILLLDDVFDKFDASRVEQIIRLVSENDFGQIFITDTDEKRIKNIISRIDIDHKIFRIQNDQSVKELV